MNQEIADMIENWVASQPEEVEFNPPDRCAPYFVVGPPRAAQRIVYATKQLAISAFHQRGDSEAIGIIGRYGLPHRIDADWLHDIIGHRELLFLGDLDPPDLFTFAWLKARLASTRVTYLGISDRYLNHLGTFVPESYRIRLSESEQRAVPLLPEILQEMERLVGPQCAAIINDGYKIEVEAVVSANSSIASILDPVFNARQSGVRFRRPESR